MEELLHHQFGIFEPQQNNGMFTTYQLVQDFAGPSTISTIMKGQYLRDEFLHHRPFFSIPCCHISRIMIEQEMGLIESYRLEKKKQTNIASK